MDPLGLGWLGYSIAGASALVLFRHRRGPQIGPKKYFLTKGSVRESSQGIMEDLCHLGDPAVYLVRPQVDPHNLVAGHSLEAIVHLGNLPLHPTHQRMQA